MPRFQSHTKRVASSSSSDVSVISNKSYRTTTSIIIFDAEKSLPTVLTVASDDDSSTSSSCSCHEDDENSCELLFEAAATRSKAGQLLDLKRSSPSLPSPLLELDGTCSNSSTTRTPAKKAVYFGNVEIRHYIVTLGDNPMCLGPPLTLSWEYEYRGDKQVSLDDCEAARKPRKDFRMPVFERRHIAKVYCGATPFEMQEVELQSSIIRHERERSYEKVLKRESNRVYYSKMLGLTFLRRKTTSKKLPVLTC